MEPARVVAKDDLTWFAPRCFRVAG